MKIEFPSLHQTIISLGGRSAVISLGLSPHVYHCRRWVKLPILGVCSTRRVRHLGPDALGKANSVDTIREQRLTRFWAPFFVMLIGKNVRDRIIYEAPHAGNIILEVSHD